MNSQKKSEIYNTLKKTRAQISIPLTVLTVTSYFSFIWVIAFKPNIFGIMLPGTNISIGILLGFLLILLIFIITLIYVYLANKKIEPIINKIKNA